MCHTLRRTRRALAATTLALLAIAAGADYAWVDWDMHPGIYVGETESASWLGGVPSAPVVPGESD
jgi:hypothetical protein